MTAGPRKKSRSKPMSKMKELASIIAYHGGSVLSLALRVYELETKFGCSQIVAVAPAKRGASSQ